MTVKKKEGGADENGKQNTLVAFLIHFCMVV